jgi:hypothetical protein
MMISCPVLVSLCDPLRLWDATASMPYFNVSQTDRSSAWLVHSALRSKFFRARDIGLFQRFPKGASIIVLGMSFPDPVKVVHRLA